MWRRDFCIRQCEDESQRCEGNECRGDGPSIGDCSPTARAGRPVVTSCRREVCPVGEAAGGVAKCEGYAEEVVPVLSDLLTDADDNVRLTAATSLRNVGPAAVTSVANLARALSDPNPQVRAAAATTLGEIGPDAAKSLPALRQLGRDPEAD